jgi:GNAT superfamily N-acetyltransferase
MKVAFPNRRSLTREELFEADVCKNAEQIATLEGKRMLKHRYGLWVGDELIGFYQGQQLLYAAYGMYGTAIVPAWQDKGIYSALLAKVLEGARAAGFIRVVSRHFPDDNVMLAAKISRGFIVNGLVLTLNSGTLVELAYYLHEPTTRR